LALVDDAVDAREQERLRGLERERFHVDARRWARDAAHDRGSVDDAGASRPGEPGARTASGGKAKAGPTAAESNGARKGVSNFAAPAPRGPAASGPKSPIQASGHASIRRESSAAKRSTRTSSPAAPASRSSVATRVRRTKPARVGVPTT